MLFIWIICHDAFHKRFLNVKFQSNHDIGHSFSFFGKVSMAVIKHTKSQQKGLQEENENATLDNGPKTQKACPIFGADKRYSSQRFWGRFLTCLEVLKIATKNSYVTVNKKDTYVSAWNGSRFIFLKIGPEERKLNPTMEVASAIKGTFSSSLHWLKLPKVGLELQQISFWYQITTSATVWHQPKAWLTLRGARKKVRRRIPIHSGQ